MHAHTCPGLYLWKRDKYNIEQAARSCKNKNLYNVFVQQTVKAMKARKLKVPMRGGGWGESGRDRASGDVRLRLAQAMGC